MLPALGRLFFFILLIAVIASCTPDGEPAADSATTSESLRRRVEAALASASDLPAAGLTVQVQDGVVIISGRLDCPDCGGSGTPGGTGTIQQSLGAVVRAVPGVESVRFEL